MKQFILKKIIACGVILSMAATSQAGVTGAGIFSNNMTTVKPLSDHIPFFMAHRQAKGITLQWTANDVDMIEIEYSYDGEFFDVIDVVGNGNRGRSTYHIPQAFPGESYFRLKGTTTDGATVYSEVVMVRIVQRK